MNTNDAMINHLSTLELLPYIAINKERAIAELTIIFLVGLKIGDLNSIGKP